MTNFISNIASDYSKAEAEAFAAFRQTYEDLNPHVRLREPLRDATVAFLSIMNVDLLLLVVKSIFTVSLSAIRTAGMFRAVVILEGTPPLWASIVAFLVVGAVEFGIVVIAVFGSYRKRVGTGNSKRGHSRMDRVWIGFSVIFALTLMIGANANTSLSVITSGDVTIIRAFIERLVLIAMGIGVPAMAVIDGHFIGNAFGAWLVHNQGIEKRYTIAVHNWQQAQASEDAGYYASVRRAWEESAQGKALAIQFKQSQQAARRSQRAGLQTTQPGAPTKVDMTIDWLQDNDPGWQTIDDVPSARDLLQPLFDTYNDQFPLSSIQKARERYMKNKGAS